MILYRYTTLKWVRVFNGEEAKKSGGRFNLKGVSGLYCCFNPSLPYIECLAANLNFAVWPEYYMVTFELDESNLDLGRFKIGDLPDKWNAQKHYPHVQEWGSNQLAVKNGLILPARVNPLDKMFILNPQMQRYQQRIQLLQVQKMEFDERILNLR